MRETRGLVPSPDGDYVAVPSDLPTFVNKAVDGMLRSTGDSRNFQDETFPVGQDENVDKAHLRNRLSIQFPADEESPVVGEVPDDLRTLWAEYDAQGDRHKTWRDFTREATFEISEDCLLMMVGLPCCTW